MARPEDARALVLAALDRHRRGDLAGAERLYRDALELDPGSFDALHMLGALRLTREDPAEALQLIGRALERSPRVARAHFNLGLALAALGRHAEAVASHDQALECEAGLAEAWNSRGNSLVALERLDEARASYARAVATRPDYSNALVNLATREQRARELAPALGHFRRAYELSPGPFTLAKYVDARHHACDWAGLAGLEQSLRAAPDSARPGPEPFVLLRASADPAEQLRRARQWASQWAGLAPNAAASPLSDRTGKLRIAYLSCDFYSHATSWLLAGVLESHDRERFEIIGVSWGRDDGSALRERVLSQFAPCLDVRGWPDEAVAAKLARLEVDVAIDLKGYTDGSRPGILARRPAPVQLSWLGYPATMGAPWIGYFVADPVALPGLLRPYFDEQVIYLPHSCQPNDRSRCQPHAREPRSRHGLPEAGFVFASFNSVYKITPEFFRVWMEILTAVPGSVLWLLADNANAATNLTNEARASGIGPERLVFAPRVPAQQHFRRQGCADLLLDTLPCCAHTTASDALAAGLPVLTCLGSTFAGRVAASVLSAAGLDELVAPDIAAYTALACGLARDPDRLGALRAQVRAAAAAAPLFDAAAFCRHLETGLSHAVARARSGAPPRTFWVTAEGATDEPPPA